MSEDDNNTCKVVFIGETGVGKTSIISQFVSRSYEETAPSTMGATYYHKRLDIDGKEVKFEIWDTAGQEKFRALTKMFYKDASVAIIVFDITSKSTFDQIKAYWAQELTVNAPPHIIKVIAANKSDLYEEEEVDEIDARLFAKEIGAIYKRTSAKIMEGIDDIFHDVGESYLQMVAQGKIVSNENKPTNISIVKKEHIKKKKKKCC